MSGLRKDELVAVFIDINGEKRKMVEDIADSVLRRVLEEEENDTTPTPIESRACSTSSSSSTSATSSSSPLSINQILSSSFTQQPLPPLIPLPVILNPFQLALCQSLVANNPLPFPVFGGPSPIFPLFVPPPQPAVESIELLKILQNILAKQKK